MGQLWPLPGPPFGGTGPANCIVFELFRLIFQKVAIFLFCKKVDNRAKDGVLWDVSFWHFERARRANFGQERRR